MFLRQLVRWAAADSDVAVGASPSLRPSVASADTAAEIGADVVGWLSTAAGLVVPWLQLAGPTGNLLERAYKARTDGVLWAEELRRLVEQLMGEAGPDRTVVVVYDDGAGPLTTTFASLVGTGSWVNEGRLILLVSLPDAPRDVAEVGEGHPEGVREAADQVQRGNAEWFWVPPLDAAALERLLTPVEPEVADYVARYSHDDLAAMALWEDLVRKGVVTRDGGPWTATEDMREWAGRRIEETLAATLDNDTDRIRRLYALLRHGAVQGLAFCGESAARAAMDTLAPSVARSLHDDRALDQLIDDLDELADAQPASLLQPATELGRDEQGTVWAYRFASPWLPSWLEATLPAYDRLVYPQRLLDQLAIRHSSNGLFDGDIARLARHAGHHDIAALYRGRVDTGSPPSASRRSCCSPLPAA